MDTLEARSDTKLEQSYLDRARELQPMLRAAADECERRREVTPEIVAAMKERGIFRMLLPRSLGGAELDPLTYTAVLEILAQGDGSPAWCLGQNSGCSMIAPYLAPEIAREVYDSIVYLESTWRDMAKDTRTGIVANVTQLLDGFAGVPVLRDRFASGRAQGTISMAEALNGNGDA